MQRRPLGQPENTGKSLSGAAIEDVADDAGNRDDEDDDDGDDCAWRHQKECPMKGSMRPHYSAASQANMDTNAIILSAPVAVHTPRVSAHAFLKTVR
jgi:hypothetical protein